MDEQQEYLIEEAGDDDDDWGDDEWYAKHPLAIIKLLLAQESVQYL